MSIIYDTRHRTEAREKNLRNILFFLATEVKSLLTNKIIRKHRIKIRAYVFNKPSTISC